MLLKNNKIKASHHTNVFSPLCLQRVMYKIDHQNRTCKKKIIKADFHPMEIPQNSTLLGQVILGSSSGPGQGLLVNSWYGELKEGKTQY